MTNTVNAVQAYDLVPSGPNVGKPSVRDATSAEILAQILVSTPNDSLLQRKGGFWVDRTIAQLIADLATGGFAVVDSIADADTTRAPSRNSVYDALLLKEDVSNKDTDTALTANSDTKYCSQKAIKAYVDGLVAGTIRDRGNHNASTNLYPSTGGSGPAGAVKKGDLWFISVTGTLNSKVVEVGDSVRALIDAPGQTNANWDVLETNIGYVPENVTNKATDLTSPDNIKYPTTLAIATALAGYGNVFKVGTPVDNQVGVWTGNGTIEGASSLTYDGSLLSVNGNIATTGDLELGNASDTTISRVAGGIVAIEGQVVATSSNSVNFTNKGLVDSNTKFINSIDGTKKLGFLLTGTATATTGTIASSFSTAKTLTLPDATDTLVGKATTDNLTNKRITRRVSSLASNANPTINTDNFDDVNITGLAVAIVSMTTNLTGTPVDGDEINISFTDDGTARAIAWGAGFEDSAVTLPLTTVINQRMDVYLKRNSVTSKWRCMSVTKVASAVIDPELARLVGATTRLATAGNTFNPQTSRNNIFTMDGNLTSLQPTANGVYHGQPLIISFKQDATGGRTASYGTNFEFTTDVGTPVLSGGANVVDDFFCTWNSITSKWRAQSFNRGA